jgi:hypothetical protein
MANQRTTFGGAFYVDVTYDPASVSTVTTAEQDVTVPGVRATDVLLYVQPPAALNAGLGVVGGRVKQANTVTIRIMNTTAGSLDAASGTWRFVFGRP